jgi:hypothetical protein
VQADSGLGAKLFERYSGTGIKREFDQHLRICPDCVAFLNTYRKTVAVAKSVRAADMPEQVRRNILGFLQARARGKRTGA